MLFPWFLALPLLDSGFASSPSNFDWRHLLWPTNINFLIYPWHGVTKIVTQAMKTTAVLLLDITLTSLSSCYCQKVLHIALYYHISITKHAEGSGKASVKTTVQRLEWKLGGWSPTNWGDDHGPIGGLITHHLWGDDRPWAIPEAVAIVNSGYHETVD